MEIVQSSLVPWGGAYRGHVEAHEFFTRLLGGIDSRVERQQLTDGIAW